MAIRGPSADGRWVLFLLFLLLIAAIVYESLAHPWRDAEIAVSDAGVKIEPLTTEAA